MHFLLTRPEVDSRAMAARLEAAGHAVTIEPLIEPVPAGEGWPPVEGGQAILVTSRNALKMLADRPGKSPAMGLPVFAVGAGTAAAARALGFADVRAGSGTAAELVPVIRSALAPGGGRLIHLAGEDLAFDLAGALREAGYDVETAVCYRMVPREALSSRVCDLIGSGRIDGVILMSPKTAEVYAGLILRHGLAAAAAQAVHLCLSAAVAARLAKLGNVVKAVCAGPSMEEMLALANRLAAQSTAKS